VWEGGGIMSNLSFTVLGIALIAGIVALAIFVNPWFGLAILLVNIRSGNDEEHD
jgi:hypothetical protein